MSLGAAITPPAPQRRPRQGSVHGRPLRDDFAWLRTDAWQKVIEGSAVLPSEIESHLQSEADYCSSVMAPLEPLRIELLAEMQARWVDPGAIAWRVDSPYEYGSRYAPDATYAQIVRRKIDRAEVEVMIDLDARMRGAAYCRLGFSTHSPDHRLAAWATDTSGAERFTIAFRDLERGCDLVDLIADAAPGGAFTNDGAGFVYVAIDAHHRKSSLRLHRWGDSPGGDTVLLQETDRSRSLHVRSTSSRRWLVVTAYGGRSLTLYLVSADQPSGPTLPIACGTGTGDWHIDEGDSQIFGLTNADGADDFKIVSARIDGVGYAPWTDLIAHRPGIILSELRAFKTHLVWIERQGMSARVMARRHRDGATQCLTTHDAAGSMYLATTDEFDTAVVAVVRSAMNEPWRRTEYRLDNGAMVPLRSDGWPAWFRSQAYGTELAFAHSADGTLVPVSVLFRHDTRRDGSAPGLLFGYGAYGTRIPADFDSARLCLIDRGFVCAIAHVRGGGEFGTAWHRSGSGRHKAAGIADFLAAAQCLVDLGFCRSGNIVAHGVSAGGALVAAAVNEAPMMFCGVIGKAPFVDVLNTMLDATLPLTAQERLEWGDPTASAAEFDALAAWSPYENIAAHGYPPILAMTGLHDIRVPYWEAAKWVARLRVHSTSRAPMLLLVGRHAGHQGSAGRQGKLDDAAVACAFAIGAATGQLSR